MKITPGYDFTSTEVPTNAKLRQMLSGGEAYGIDITQIDASLIGLKVEGSSVSLPAEGWMWVGVDGCVWVNTRNGPAKIFRGNWGGLETRRYPIGAPTTNPPINNGQFLYQCVGGQIGFRTGYPSGATLESNVFFSAAQCGDARYKNLETGYSGSYTRALIWGFGWFPVQSMTYTNPSPLIGASNNAYDRQYGIPYSAPANPLSGLTYGVMTDSALSAIAMSYGYQFGLRIARLG